MRTARIRVDSQRLVSMWYALPKARKRATANVLTSQDPVIRIWVSVLGELKREENR